MTLECSPTHYHHIYAWDSIYFAGALLWISITTTAAAAAAAAAVTQLTELTLPMP